MPGHASGEDADFDIVIVGGGMVGSMLAAALAVKSSLKIAVVEQQLPKEFARGSNPDYDIRVSALSVATQRMFENVGAWDGVVSRRACPYREMLVWDGEERGSTHFKAHDIGATELGHIVENRVVQLALLDVVEAAPNVQCFHPTTLDDYQVDGDHVACRLSSRTENADESEQAPQVITTRLLVGADGATSRVRRMAGIEAESSLYPQHALVATIETANPQQDITWQRFKPTGPEAFLPLCGSQASMVWYHTPDEVQRLCALSDENFIDAMQKTFPERLGKIERVLARGSFPIAKAHAAHYIAERVALIGDAAHTVHPLAGQGVNLGMLDAAALAQVVLKAESLRRDYGSARVLRRYERWRRSDNAIMISILDSFYHAFKSQPRPVRLLRSAALQLADNAGPLKGVVMRYAMGTGGDLPTLAQRQPTHHQVSGACQN